MCSNLINISDIEDELDLLNLQVYRYIFNYHRNILGLLMIGLISYFYYNIVTQFISYFDFQATFKIIKQH